MEKKIFLDTLKNRLIEMDMSKKTIQKHLKIFKGSLKGKSPEEIDKVIEGAGGIDGIVKSICDLHTAKQKNTSNETSTEIPQITEETTEECSENEELDVESKESDISLSDNQTVTLPDSKDATEEQTEDIIPVTEEADTTKQETADSQTLEQSVDVTAVTEEQAPTATEEADSKSLEIDKSNSQNSSENDNIETKEEEDNPPTIEIPKTSEIEEHIREAEEMSDTLERIPVSNLPEIVEECSEELSDYDFEKLFAEKLTILERFAKWLRRKMNKPVFLLTLPISIAFFAVMYTIILALFPIIILTAIAFIAVYLILLISGVCFTLIPVGYGIYMCFKSIPIALYELGIAATSSGVTMFFCILLYNYVKRFVPFLLKQLVKLFKLWIRIAKRFFKKPVEEEK